MSSIVYCSSVFIFLLLLFNGASVALGAVPTFYGSTQAFQILQIVMAGAAFILTLSVPCCVIAKRGKTGYIEPIMYLIITLLDVVASVLVTLRWLRKNLEKDYSHVPNRQTIVIVAVCVYWAASLAGLFGFFLAMIDAFRRAIRKGKPSTPAYDQRVPPRELKTAPYAHPFTSRTTYMRP